MEQPRNCPDWEADVVRAAEGNMEKPKRRTSKSGRPGFEAPRGPCMGHVRKGFPGTWEILSPPPESGRADKANEEVATGDRKSQHAMVPMKRGNAPQRTPWRDG